MTVFTVRDFSSRLVEMVQAPTSSQAASSFMVKHDIDMVYVYDATGSYTVFDRESTGVSLSIHQEVEEDSDSEE